MKGSNPSSFLTNRCTSSSIPVRFRNPSFQWGLARNLVSKTYSAVSGIPFLNEKLMIDKGTGLSAGSPSLESNIVLKAEGSEPVESNIMSANSSRPFIAEKSLSIATFKLPDSTKG